LYRNARVVEIGIVTLDAVRRNHADQAIANVGVHGTGMSLPLDTLWISNITIAMGLVNTDTTATLLKMVAEHTLPADLFVSHTFDLDDIEEAYDVFGRAAETQALKVALNA